MRISRGTQQYFGMARLNIVNLKFNEILVTAELLFATEPNYVLYVERKILQRKINLHLPFDCV